MEQIKSQVDNLPELPDEQVEELQAAIIAEFESVEAQEPTSETVDAMTSLADMLDTVRGEVQRREALAAELAAQAAEAAMRVKGEEVPAEDTDMEEPMDSTETEEPMVEDMPSEEEDTMDSEFSAEAEADVASIEPVEGAELATDSTESEQKFTAEEAELSVEESVELSNETPETEEAVVASADVVEEVSEIQPTENQDAPVVEQEEQAPVTASADQPFEAPADRQPVVQVTEVPVAITAGADIPGYTAGSPINDMGEVAQAMEKRIHSLRRVNGGDGEQHIVASITTQYPEALMLSTDAETNMSKINSATAPEALTASGGFGQTLYENKYDIFNVGSTTLRPVRDALPRFQADRGGIRFVEPPYFASGAYEDAAGIWTAAVDADPDGATKSYYVAEAAQEVVVTTDAITLQLQFGNLMTRAYPELIARHNELALVQHARVAEQNLLSKIGAGSTAVTTAGVAGFARDFLVQVRTAATAYRSRHRIDPNARLKVIIPAWVYDAMAADLALAMPGDGTISVSKAEVEGYVNSIGVDLVTTFDSDVFGAQAVGALDSFPATFDWYMFAEGTFLFLDGGTLDLGIIRDSSLVGTNDYKMFVETFENVAKVGVESLKVTSTFQVSGAAAALVDTGA